MLMATFPSPGQSLVGLVRPKSCMTCSFGRPYFAPTVVWPTTNDLLEALLVLRGPVLYLVAPAMSAPVMSAPGTTGSPCRPFSRSIT
jgi:hypothetical protein